MIDRCCISLTERCNLRCRYCHFSCEGRRSSDITEEEIDSVLSSILGYVRKHDVEFKVGIVGGGEPTLRFDSLKHVVDTLQTDGRIRMYTISNGVNLSDDMLDYLWDRRDILEFCVSLDGDRDLHDLNRVDRNGNGTFSDVFDTIRRYEDRFGCKPAVNCTVTSEHMKRGRELIEFFSNNGFKKVTYSRIFDSPDEVGKEEFDVFLNKASESMEVRQLRKKTSFDCAQYGALCGVGRTNIYIASGRIYPCARFAGMDDYCLGSVSDSLDVIEGRLKRHTPCESGTCYYDTVVKKGGRE